MNRTQAFLLPDLPLTMGVPVIDKKGRRGIIVDKWFCKDTNLTKVRVCRIHRFKGEAIIETVNSMEVRIDLSNDIGFVYALREYFNIVNAKAREEVKAYVWTWGDLHEQAVRWWAKAIGQTDERRLIKKLINSTNTEEH